jgi:outer membrane lipoprotein-sorting protein
VTINSRSDGDSQSIRYFYKSPGYVRMEFIRPHKGAVILYSPVTKKARVRPFVFLRSLVLTLSPRNSLITSPAGHRVDASDMGSLLKEASTLADQGRMAVVGSEKVSGRETLLVEVNGAGNSVVNGGVHRYLLWLDVRTFLPVRTKSFNISDEMLEDVVMDDLEIDPDLPDSLFEQPDP